MLSVLSWCNALLIRPPHDPARKAGDRALFDLFRGAVDELSRALQLGDERDAGRGAQYGGGDDALLQCPRWVGRNGGSRNSVHTIRISTGAVGNRGNCGGGGDSVLAPDSTAPW